MCKFAFVLFVVTTGEHLLHRCLASCVLGSSTCNALLLGAGLFCLSGAHEATPCHQILQS